MTLEHYIVYNQVESNGKTVKENNLTIPHTIPLKTFVEINCECSDSHGCRGFVVSHERDCDGEPLYGIGFKRRIIEDLEMLKNAQDDLGQAMCRMVRAEINGGWSEDNLIILPNPN